MLARCAGLQTAFNSHHPPPRKKCSSQKTLAFFNNTILNLAQKKPTRKILRVNGVKPIFPKQT